MRRSPIRKSMTMKSKTDWAELKSSANADGAAIYKYLNFNQIEEYVDIAKGVTA